MRTLLSALSVMLLLTILAACVESDSTDDASDEDVTAEAAASPTEEPEDPDPTATEEPEPTPEPTATAAEEATATIEPEPDPTATSEPDDGDDEGEEHIISIVDNAFDPDEIEIAPGDTITWVNDGGQMHTSTLDPEIARDPENAVLPDGAETWDSGDMEPGDEFSITLDVPGEYIYFCRPHEALDMIGTIVVTDEDADTGGSDDDDDDEEIDDYL